MATHSSVLAWRIPGMGEPGGLLSLGLHRVGYAGSDLAAGPSKGSSQVLKTIGTPSLLSSVSCINSYDPNSFPY